MEKIYLLICTGNNDNLDGTFRAVCKYGFKENPINNPKYEKEVSHFLASCKDSGKYFTCVQEGTEKLLVRELEII